MPKISGDERMYRRPSAYSCQGLTTSFSVRAFLAGRKDPFSRRSREMESAEKTNESALKTNAGIKPALDTIVPAAKAPMVRVIHPVVCVRELAVCNSSRLVMVGRMADLPLVKNGDANIRTALKL